MTTSARRFRSLVRATAQVVWTATPQGDIVEDSPTWREFTGQSFEQWAGRGWLDAIHPDDRETTVDQWRIAIAQRDVYEAEYRLWHNSGAYRWTMARAVPVFDDSGEILEWIGINSDIHQKKQAELSLIQAERQARQSELKVRRAYDLLAGILESSSGLIAAIDREFNFIAMNSAFRVEFNRVFKYDIQVGANLLEVLSNWPEDAQRLESWWSRAIQGDHVSVTAPFGTACQIQKSFAFRFYPLRDAQGNIIGASKLATDINELVQSEQAAQHLNRDLARRVHEFETLLDVLPVGIGVAADAECKTIRTNRAFAKILRIDVDQNASLTADQGEAPTHFRVYDRDGKEVPPDQLPMQVAAREGRTVMNLDVDIVFSDGERRTLSEHVAPLFDEHGHTRGCVGVFVDVTEQRLAMEKLREADEQFRMLADSIPQLAWMARPDGHIYWYNQRWYEYTGATFAEMEGWGWERVHDPVELQRMLPNWKKSLSTGEPWYDLFPLRRHDGQMRWHLSLAQPLFNERGEVVRWFGTNTDITPQRELQEALREADRKKDEFLATLAHELRNPLAPIRNAIHLIRLQQQRAESVEDSLNLMERQLNQMVRLVDDLFDLSRISRGRIALQRQDVELAKVVRSAIETSMPWMEQAFHEFCVTIPEEPLWINGDLVRLAQVFANLLNNAAKYTERGGTIHLTVKREERHATISVRDNGMGIPRGMLPLIFEMFTQVDRSLEKSQGGLGIGLTIVKRLLEIHGGTIEAHSEGPGSGSEFVVKLPLIEPKTKPGTEGSAGATVMVAGNKRRILVVDDNRDSAKSLALMLKLMGNESEVAHDGLEAIDKANAFRPQLILLDIGLPKLNGYEVCKRLRESDWGYKPFITALTGWGQETDRQRSSAAGFDEHIVKPIDVEALKRILTKI